MQLYSQCMIWIFSAAVKGEKLLGKRVLLLSLNITGASFWQKRLSLRKIFQMSLVSQMCPDVEDMLFMYQDRYNSLTKSEAKIPVSQVLSGDLQFSWKTLPKAQRTRGLSSYHQLLHKSSNFISTKLKLKILTKLQQVLSCHLHMPESHQSITSSLLNGSELVSEWVSDKRSQLSDSGPIKIWTIKD